MSATVEGEAQKAFNIDFMGAGPGAGVGVIDVETVHAPVVLELIAHHG